MPRILIIDDDDPYRATVRKMLEKAGYDDIEEAANGKIGMKIFRRQPFDLVITDMIMPDQEGIETIRELIRTDPRIKIIAISGGGRMAPQGYLEMAGNLGAHRTLAKPFQKADLIEMVQALLIETKPQTI